MGHQEEGGHHDDKVGDADKKVYADGGERYIFNGGDDKFIFPKVEITTTKNVERKIHRQLVLEDGRVVEEEVFIFALFNDNYDMSIVI